MKFKNHSHTKGSITIEAMIVLPVIISIFMAFIFVISYIRVTTTIKHDLLEKAYEIAVYDYGCKMVAPSIVHLYSQKQLKSMNIEYFFCYSETFGHDITLYLDCTYNGYIKKIDINLTQKVKKWKGDGINFSDTNVWSLPNLTRGLEIEKLFGCNLPRYFPGIDGYNEYTGEILVITSIDTTYENYRSYDYFYKRVEEMVDKLLSFEGASYDHIDIKESDIEYRKLMIVLPKNSLNRAQLNVLEEMKRYCNLINVELVVKRYQYADTNN